MTDRILIVEDDPGIVDVVSFALGSEGFLVSTAGNGEDALFAMQEVSPDLVILDIGLPEMSGIELCRRIRQVSAVPIIILTVFDREIDKVIGLEVGADDYVTKPFSIVELTSRVRSALRRREMDRHGLPATVWDMGWGQLDVERHELTLESTTIALTATEFRVLRLLASRPGRALTRRQIVDHIGDVAWEGGERLCDYHVHNLRRKIEIDATRPVRIVTVRGVGYRLDVNPGSSPGQLPSDSSGSDAS